MRNFNTRSLSALPLLFLGFICIYLESYFIYFFISLIFLILNFEWNFFFFKKNYLIIIILLINTALLQLFYFINNSIFIFMLIFNIIFIIYLNYRYKYNFIYSIVSFYFLISLLSAFYLIDRITDIKILYIIFLSVILLDTYSYIFGKLFKGKKLIPKISPGKTISGYIFGILFTFISLYLFNSFFFLYENNLKFILFLSIIFLSSILGDIIESLIKRKLLIKDISNFLPGHGGFFDRFDSFLFVFIVINFFYLF